MDLTTAVNKGISIDIPKDHTVAWFLDRVTAFLLALCPILQHYSGLLGELSADILVILLPYSLYKLVFMKRFYIRPLIPLFLFAVYISVIHGISVFILAREMLLVLYYFLMVNGVVSFKKFFLSAKAIGILAFVLLVVQYILYYGFHYHLQLVPTGMLLDSAEQWVALAQTGRISVTGVKTAFYRPSAFFLEPSHLTIYCIPVLILNLFCNDRKGHIKQSVMITLAMVMSTSGMGIMASGGIWILYVVHHFGGIALDRRGGYLSMHRNIVLFGLAMLISVVVMYVSVSSFRGAINRIFVSSTEGNNAIAGRTASGIRMMRRLSGADIVIGTGNRYKLSQMNISGFFYTLVQYGVIGVVLLYYLYFKSLFVLDRGHFWLSLIVIGLSFFTVHTYAAFYRMYFMLFLLSGYPPRGKRENRCIV